MAVEFLDAMAQAIYFYEGHQPQDPNHRNNNPGNLRPAEGNTLPVSSEGYVIFPGFIQGYLALIDDIRAKITGYNTHGLNSLSTLREFFQVYAPSKDDNDPLAYAQFVAFWLSKTYGVRVADYVSFHSILVAIDQKVG